MKKQLALLLVVVFAFSMFAGCGNKSEEAAAETEVIEVQTEDEELEEDDDVIVAESSDSASTEESDEESRFTIDVEFAVLGTDRRGTSGMVYLISRVTNNSTSTYSLNWNSGNIKCKAYMNDQELEKPYLGTMDVPGDIAPGETKLVGTGFAVSEVGDITFKWYDEVGNETEITTVTYTTDVMLQASKDFVNDSFDTTEYKDAFVLLEGEVKDFLEDIGEL